MANRLAGFELGCDDLFDEVPCYISIVGRDLRVLRANRTLAAEFGDPAGRHCYAVYKGRSGPCPECPVARTFEDGRDHSSEEVIFDRRGLPHNVLARTRPLRNGGGEIVAVMELLSDITVQKEFEHRLHDSLGRFHRLFDLAPCYISVQNRELRIVEANDYFKQCFGNPGGAHCYEVYKTRREPCPDCPVLATFNDGRIHTGEHVWVGGDRKEILVVVQTAPIRNRRGEITDVMEVSTDITNVRALQDQLASLGKIVGGIAHSVKNVLEGLRGGVYIVNLGFRDGNQEDVRTGWSMVERNVKRLSGMVLDMLYCAKERSPRRLPVRVAEVCRESVNLLEPRARECGVRIEADLPDPEVTIFAEPKDIESLVSNLVVNALDACCSDQTPEKAHRVVVRAMRRPGEVVIEVEDNGIGMDEETRGKLFTAFFSTKGAFGTGLGLLVAHKVAAELGGGVSVRSEPGQGATFTVRFPVQEAV